MVKQDQTASLKVTYGTSTDISNTGRKTNEHGVSSQRSSGSIWRRARLTMSVVPAVYHYRIRDKLIDKPKTCDDDVYSGYSMSDLLW